MSYLEALKTAVVFFPFIAFIFTVPFVLRQYHKYGSINKLRVLIVYSFILYLISVYFLVILPLPPIEDVRAMTGPSYNFVPFTFVKDFFKDTVFSVDDIGSIVKAVKQSCFFVVAFNILMTIPFGMYLRYYFKCGFVKTVFSSLLLSVFFELTQLSGLYFIYPRPYRLCDVDDLILNTVGGLIGFLIMGIIDNHLPTREKIDSDSYEIGKSVSGLRRITLFFLDGFIFCVLTSLVSIAVDIRVSNIIVFVIYFGVIPCFKNKQTWGQKFLNVRLEYPSLRFFKLLVTSFFNYLYYCIMPAMIIMLFLFLHERYTPGARISVVVLLGTCAAFAVFYLINIIVLWVKKKAFYDKITKVTFISTIDEKNN